MIILDFIEINLNLIVIIMTVLILALLAGFIIMIIKQKALKKRYNSFMCDIYDKKNLEEVIETLVNQVKYQEEKTIELGKRIAILENNIKFTVQKTALLRYRAFDNKGGDQSFSFVILDEKNNGMVLTSIYNDGISSVYGKDIKNGKSEHRLSEEEIKAIEIAMQFSNKNILEPN